MAILFASLLAAAALVFKCCLMQPNPGTAFLGALIVFYAIRVGVELDFLDPFSPGSLLLPVLWVYVWTIPSKCSFENG